jgi:hypothetical protein
LYNPAMKVGQYRKFRKVWTGPFQITSKISDLNYEIVSQNSKKQIVRVNRLKRAYDPGIWRPKRKQHNLAKRKSPAPQRDELEEDEILIISRPLLKATRLDGGIEPRTPPNVSLGTPESMQLAVETPYSERTDPSYHPPETPRSRREMQEARAEPPLTHVRARIQIQGDGLPEA